MFKVGDCVVLKSGSPRMTVAELVLCDLTAREPSVSKVKVVWFDGGFEERYFVPTVLLSCDAVAP